MANNKDRKKEIQTKNKIIKISLISLTLVIVFVICFILAGGYFSKERRVNDSIASLGTSFYEDFYYEKVSDGKSSEDTEKFLKQFKKVGIVVSLYNLEKYNSKGNEEYIKRLKNYDCDQYKTTVTIYPKSPYKKDSYTMKANLSCGKIK